MPNWCYTTMKVSGDDTELKQFLDGIAKTDIGTYEILHTYFPRPEAISNTRALWHTDNAEEAEAHLVTVAENIANYGHGDWYEWSIANWGTKWGDCESRLLFYTVGEAVFQLESAWTPITIGMQIVSRQFPNLYFILNHVEEAGFYLGSEAIRDGKMLCESFCAPCDDYTPPVDDADEDYWDYYSDWAAEETEKHLKIVLDTLAKGGHTLPTTITESE